MIRPLRPLCVFALMLTPLAVVPAAAIDVWFGTATPQDGLSRGIYHARFDTNQGQLSRPTLAAEVNSPGFLALHPRLDVLYSVGNHEGKPSLLAFQRNTPEPGKLQLLGAQPVGDGGAAHLAVDATGTMLISAQYGGGSTAVFPLAEDGSIQPRAQLHEHTGGSGVVERRQQAPHAHWTGFAPDNRFAFVPDLGIDRVVIYRVDNPAQPTELTPHGEGVCPPGSGPRHMKFSPDGKTIYVLNELSLTVTRFAYDAEAGTMTPIDTVPTLTEEEKAGETFNSASEIRVHPSGQFVYSANRGHDTITVFSVDPRGALERIEVEPIRGGWPRNFNVDPSGTWLIAAGRDSHTAAVFKIDPSTGQLTYRREMAMVPSPICVLFGRP